MTVSFGNINPGKVGCRFMQSLIECHGMYEKLLIHMAGPYLDVARNIVVEKFYHDESAGDYLHFVDSDIAFSPKNLEDLMSFARPDRIVSGIYYSYFAEFGELRPVVGRFTYDEKLKAPSIKPVQPRVLEDVNEEGLVKVDGVGAGFMVIPRTIFTHMLEVFGWPMPWFITQCIDATKQWYGEDYMFCLRANSLGYPTYAVPSVRVGHSKELQL